MELAGEEASGSARPSQHHGELELQPGKRRLDRVWGRGFGRPPRIRAFVHGIRDAPTFSSPANSPAPAAVAVSAQWSNPSPRTIADSGERFILDVPRIVGPHERIAREIVGSRRVPTTVSFTSGRQTSQVGGTRVENDPVVRPGRGRRDRRLLRLLGLASPAQEPDLAPPGCRVAGRIRPGPHPDRHEPRRAAPMPRMAVSTSSRRWSGSGEQKGSGRIDGTGLARACACSGPLPSCTAGDLETENSPRIAA